MKRVRDAGRVIKMRRQSRTETLRQIGGDNLDAAKPGRIGVGGPSPQIPNDGSSAPFAETTDAISVAAHRPLGVGAWLKGSFAERTVPTNGVPETISVTFVSGPYLVIMAVRDSDGAPTTAAQLTAIAKRAQKRLTAAPTI